MQFWKTQFCGRTQKLLPKAGWRLVLSAPEKKSPASIATATSDYEDRPSTPANTDALPAFGCRRDKNQPDPKRRVGPQILPDPLLSRAGVDPRQIQSGARREPALRAHREFSRYARNSRARDLFSRSGRRTDLARRLGQIGRASCR